jgi:hypothetical protein
VGWRYLPRDTDQSSYASVFTGEPVTINERAKRCAHVATTYFNFSDLRSDDLARYSGQCCVACGRIVTIVKVE